ncbi:hypothetical protein M9H77_12356 [Catharanthus roseus]|uniref:Uncharacterized protein n=1 Tax=Catharanthus roseus TaxID=4058 RepID=A0ACC0BH64_CATRO|nr:hypothetical protein M9H77_12356 [Catharanthus roseus]
MNKKKTEIIPIYYNKKVTCFTFREVVGWTARKRRKRRIPQVKPMSLKQIQTLYLSAKIGPFFSQPSHTHGVKDDSRHRLSAVESRRAERKTNRESVRRREREDKRLERESVGGSSGINRERED